eukprot:scaffold15007_cov129-Isochrysis_galbana.AAC.3
MSAGPHYYPRRLCARAAHPAPLHIAQMVLSMSDPFEPTAAELAGEDPAVSEMDTTQERGTGK